VSAYELFPVPFIVLSMDRYRERQVIFERLERYRELLRQFPDGPTSETICDYIADMERRLRDLDK
jgi:hypothetical protein